MTQSGVVLFVVIFRLLMRMCSTATKSVTWNPVKTMKMGTSSLSPTVYFSWAPLSLQEQKATGLSSWTSSLNICLEKAKG